MEYEHSLPDEQESAGAEHQPTTPTRKIVSIIFDGIAYADTLGSQTLYTGRLLSPALLQASEHIVAQAVEQTAKTVSHAFGQLKKPERHPHPDHLPRKGILFFRKQRSK